MRTTREQALRFRYHRHQLGGGQRRDDVALLDLGVQDTGGSAAARWALTLRGCEVDAGRLLLAWTLRGAPHAYRRSEAAAVAAATSPYDEADAAKRVFDAAKPLREAGIPVIEALDTIASHLRDIVTGPTPKGDASTALTSRLPEPYLRACRPCGTVHVYEQPFRFAALRAGLELEPETSPPVLRPIEGWVGPAEQVPDRLDPVRAAVRLYGPTTPQLVAGQLDAPVRTVRRRWPVDTVPVSVDGEQRQVLEEDAELLREAPPAQGVRLLGAFDPWLQVRDRELLVADGRRRAQVWRTLGRPGVVLVDGEVAGTWRPRASGGTLRLRIELWDGGDPSPQLDAQAERLAAHRGRTFGGYTGDAPPADD